MKPKVSVIIPVYNVERYLGACLDSILGQTLREVEVLCVDDGSTDGSAKILADFAARDTRVRVFSAPHAGAFRAREVGVRAARGEYIYFMDADDLLKPEAFAELCGLCDREKLDQIVFASDVFCEDDVSANLRRWAGRMVRYYTVKPFCCGRVMTGMDLLRTLFDGDCFHVSPPLRLIRAETIQERDYPFPKATSRADNYFTVLSLYYAGRAMAVPSRYYLRRVRNGSITTEAGSSVRHCANLLDVLLSLRRFAPFRDEWLDPRSVLSRFCTQLMVAVQGKSKACAPTELNQLICTALAEASDEERAFMLQLGLAAIQELKRRPTIGCRSLLTAFLRTLWRRLRGHRDRPSFIH